MNETDRKRHEFWDQRALIGENAGSNDFNLKYLEVRELSKFMKDGLKVLEIGCGNGLTSIQFAKEFNIEITAVDYSKNMIEKAREFLKENQKTLKGTVSFSVLSLSELNQVNEKFDLVFTERVLINLSSWDEQKSSLYKIAELLNGNGIYCMCESSMSALDNINKLRSEFDLPEITHPWHNTYIDDQKLEQFDNINNKIKLVKTSNFSSTYYLFSRVVNARLASDNNEEVSYSHPLNKISLDLPSFGDYSQSKLWIFKKLAQSDELNTKSVSI